MVRRLHLVDHAEERSSPCGRVIDRTPFAPVRRLLSMVRDNGGVDVRRLPVLLAYMLRYSLLEPFRLVEAYRCDRMIRDYSLAHPPVFILGYWRSGTSFLQALLRLDANLATSTLFRSLFADVYWSTESWLKPALNALCRVTSMDYALQRVRMDWDLPAEGDVALCSSFSAQSYTWGHLFPKSFCDWIRRLVWQPDVRSTNAWLEHYDYTLRKLSRSCDDKRLVVKSPGDTARMAHLLRKYPGASFIYIHRDPFAVFQSNRYLWNVVQRQVSLHTVSDEVITELIIDSYKRILSTYLAQRRNIPCSQLVEIRYEDLAAVPVATLDHVYRTLELGDVPTRAVVDHLRSQKLFQPQRYATPSELEARLRREWSFAFAEWGG